MGTIYCVKYIATPKTLGEPETVEHEIARCLDSVNAKMSTYTESSDLSVFNASRSTEFYSVSQKTLDVFTLAQEISEWSGGAFDITIGPIVNAYGFGPDSETALPTEEELNLLRERVGYRNLEIDPSRCAIRKLRPDLYCDLSAIAKGHAVDQIAEILDGNAFDCYMIDIGGEIRARGTNKKNEPWCVGVSAPDESGTVLQRVLYLNNQSVATSGDYQNFRMIDGKRVSHIIDPRTGRPIAHNTASVTVIQNRCARADALATALMVLGAEEGFPLAQKDQIPALFVIRNPDGSFSLRPTFAFKSFIAAMLP